MSKLLDKVGERESCRALVLELRRAISQRTADLAHLQQEISSASTALQRESVRLVELTREVAQLAHADLAGIVGTSGGNEPAVVPDTASA